MKIRDLAGDERRTIIANTAAKMGLGEAIVEKDLWVSLALSYLFNRCPFAKSFTFKGGTSLSKGYHLINRFSEDIDLILDWRILGYENEEPWLTRSHTKQDTFNKEANKRACEFIENELLPVIAQDLKTEWGADIDISLDSHDAQTINISYPNLYSDSSILRQIRVEIGPLAAWTPSEQVQIKAFAEEHYTGIIDEAVSKVLIVRPERTFWEKATILHHEAHRPENLMIPARYSRHYYDLYMMGKTDVKTKALSQPELLKRVADFKDRFYPRKWARYDLALPGTLRLVPPEQTRLRELKKDYEKMQAMLYGDIPSFDDIIMDLENLESEINRR